MRSNKMRAVKFMEENHLFRESCKLASLPITKRQASKFRLGKGAAFQVKDKVIRLNLIKEGVINEVN